MVFPVESEDRTTRNLLMLCQDHTRLVVEILRKALAMIDALTRGEVKPLHVMISEIEKMHAESEKVKMTTMKELHGVGSVLVDREDFYRLISKSSELTDYMEEISFRILGIGDKKWRIPKDVGEGLIGISGASFETLTKLRESLLSLGFNSERAVVLARDVDESERKVDSIYRELDFSIINSKMELPLILILRDVARMMEEMVDAAKEEADLIRIIAL